MTDNKLHGVDRGNICERQTITTFKDGEAEEIAGWQRSSDPMVPPREVSGTSLTEWFQRPVLIKTLKWDEAVNPQFTTYPFEDWATNTYVKEKLNRYYLLRGDLMLKVVVNGTKFHYGNAMLSWNPMAGTSQLPVDNLTHAYNSDAALAVLCKLSQRPHLVIDPGRNSAGCLCLPFVYPKDFLRVPVTQDFRDMGVLSFVPYTDIASTGSAFTTPEIRIYAWMENVTVQVSTKSGALTASLLSSLLPSAQGDEFDEQQGVISKTANAVADAAGALQDVPIIGPGAKASQQIATAIGTIAKTFGYSKPADVGTVNRMRRLPGGNIANTDGPDDVDKLTYDTRQEVNIDPRTVGLSAVDEMTVDFMAKKESFLTQIHWQETSAGNIWKANVSPNPALRELVTANDAKWQPTSLSFVSQPFQYWTGSLEYRFEFMAATNHSGRVVISYDPYSDTNLDNADDEPNVLYSTVVDLNADGNSPGNNVSLTIPWLRERAFDDVRSSWQVGHIQTPNSAFVPYTKAHNGFIGVNVINQLQAPTTGAGIYINVYVKAGPDFKLFSPHESALFQFSYFRWSDTPPAEEMEIIAEAQGMDEIDAIGATGETPAEELIAKGPDISHQLGNVYHGDPVTSIRSVLKRYNLSEAITFSVTGTSPSDDSTLRRKYVEPNFPRYWGYDPNGMYEVGTAPNNAAFTPAHMTMLNYFTPAFVGWRGGLRVKYYPTGIKSVLDRVYDTYLERTPAAIPSAYSAVLTGDSTYTNPLYQPANTVYTLDNAGTPGANVIVPNQQGVFSVEFPYYSRYKFSPARRLNMNGLEGTELDDVDRFKHSIRTCEAYKEFDDASATTLEFNQVGYRKYVAAGDDFSLFGFVNAPPIIVLNPAKPALTAKIEKTLTVP